MVAPEIVTRQGKTGWRRRAETAGELEVVAAQGFEPRTKRL